MRILAHVVIVACTLAFNVAALRAATPTGDGYEEALAQQLEALQQRQAERIAALEQQVAARTQDVPQQRDALLRDQIREVLSSADFRESLMPSGLQAGYDHGFFIRSTDDQFLMKFQWLVQARYTYYQSQPENRYLVPGFRRSDRSGFDFTRARFRIFGHVFDKDLTYFLSLTHAENTAYDVRNLYAYVDYRFSDAFHVAVGQMRLNGSRAQMRKISTYQFPELPFSDAVFGGAVGVGVGVRFWGQPLGKRVSWWLDVTNSWSGNANRTITNDPPELDGDLAVVFRAVWHVLGKPGGADFAEQADLACLDAPALDLGFHYGFNNDERDSRTSTLPFTPRNQPGVGAFGLTRTTGAQVHRAGVEAALKYRGFSAVAEYHVAVVDVKNAEHAPFTPYYQLTGDDSTNVHHGGYLQVGYMLPIPGQENKWEVVSRLEGVAGVDPDNQGTWIYAAGVNYYFEPEVKLQMDVSKVVEAPISASTYSLANVNDNALIWRVQMTFAF